MNKIIVDWIYVIKNCSVENTYKMSWCKSIIECCFEDTNKKEISFSKISEKMFKYYWNQTIFFNLEQNSNSKKPPSFISYVKSKIDTYQKEYGFQPIELQRIEDKVDIDLRYLNNVLKKNVIVRFLIDTGT